MRAAIIANKTSPASSSLLHSIKKIEDVRYIPPPRLEAAVSMKIALLLQSTNSLSIKVHDLCIRPIHRYPSIQALRQPVEIADYGRDAGKLFVGQKVFCCSHDGQGSDTFAGSVYRLSRLAKAALLELLYDMTGFVDPSDIESVHTGK